MTIPSYTAEASLYKTAKSYRGYSQASKFSSTSIVPAMTCQEFCGTGFAAAMAFCLPGGLIPGVYLGCLAIASVQLGICLGTCPPPPSDPLPNPNPIPNRGGECGCPSGQKCCECDDNMCSLCVRGNQVCP
jgi:hypothetical protein